MAAPRVNPFAGRSTTRPRTNLGTNLRGRAGVLTFLPNWEDLLAPQVLDDFTELTKVAYQEANRLHAPDVDQGDVKSSIGATLDARDGSVYLYAGHWDAKYTEFGTGPRGKATAGSRGADAFPTSYQPDYGQPRTPPGGLPARPFIRPAAVAAVRRVFGFGGGG